MVTKVSTEHLVTNKTLPIAHGVMRFDLNQTTLASVTNASQVIKLAEVGTDTGLIIEDAWLEIKEPFDTGTIFKVGDGAFDNAILSAIDVSGSKGVIEDFSYKGVLLANNSTAFVTDKITLVTQSSTAISQQSAAGEVCLYIAFKEVSLSSEAVEILSTSSETPMGDGTVPASSGGSFQVAGTIGQIQYNDGNGQLAAYTPADARTHLELELATSDSAAAGGKVLKVNSGGITSGDLLSINSNGEIVSGGPHLMPAGNVGDVQTKGSYGLDSIAIATADSAAAGGKLLKVSSAGVTSGDLLTIDSNGEIVAGSGGSGSMSFDVQGDDTNVSPVTINSGGKLDFNGGSNYILCKASAGSGSNEADITVEDFPTGVSSGEYALGTIDIDGSGKILSAHSNVHSVKNNYCTWSIVGGVSSSVPNGFLGANGLAHSSNLIAGRTGTGKNPFYTHYVYHRHRNAPGAWANPAGITPWTFLTYPDPADYPIGTTITISFAVPHMPLMQNPYGSNASSSVDPYHRNALVLTPDKTLHDQGNWSGSVYIDNEIYLHSNITVVATPASGYGFGDVLLDVYGAGASAPHVPVFPLFSNESVTLTVTKVLDISASELTQPFDSSMLDLSLQTDNLPTKVAWKVIARGCTNASSDIYQSLYDMGLRV